MINYYLIIFFYVWYSYMYFIGILIGMFIVGVRIDMDKLKDVVLFKIVKEDE